MRISKRRVLGPAVVAVLALVGSVSVAGAAAPPKFQVTVRDDLSSGSLQFVVETVPPVLAPAVYKVGFANNSLSAPHEFVAIGGLPAGITVDEFIGLLDAFFAGAPPPEGVFDVGGIPAKPGQNHQKQFNLTTPGGYGFFCPVRTPEGTPHYRMGFVGLFDVAAAS